MNKIVKQVLLTIFAFVIPFIMLLIFGCGFVMSFVIALIVDAFVAGAFFVYHKMMAKVKDVSYEEICDRATEVVFRLKQDGKIIESVTIGPLFMEIEYKDNENSEIEKSTVPYAAWGIDGKKTYIHASKAVKDYLGKRYSILMAGDYIVISKRETQTTK